MGNLGWHNGRRGRDLIEPAGARMIFRWPYSPDFESVEMAFAKIEALLRNRSKRTVDDLRGRIGENLNLATFEAAHAYLRAAGYNPDLALNSSRYDPFLFELFSRNWLSK